MIYVDDTYFIKVDSVGYAVCKKMIAKKSGIENQKVIGYYTTILNALKGIEEEMIKDFVRETETENIPISDAILKKKEIRNKLKKIRRELEDEKL